MTIHVNIGEAKTRLSQLVAAELDDTVSITLHGIPNCDTVKKARAAFAEGGVAYDFRDFKKSPPATHEVARWAAASGWEKLLNRAGTTFRKLPDGDRAGLDEARAVALMVAHPSAIRRPVVEHGGMVAIGLDAALAVAGGLAKRGG